MLGVFGAPEGVRPRRARRRCAALEIAEARRGTLRDAVGVGIGVNTGTVIVGTVGGGGRIEFTVIGDAVNTASRVEAATRETGEDVLITEATRVQLPEGLFEFEPRDKMTLKGKRHPVELWRPYRADAETSPGEPVATAPAGR